MSLQDERLAGAVGRFRPALSLVSRDSALPRLGYPLLLKLRFTKLSQGIPSPGHRSFAWSTLGPGAPPTAYGVRLLLLQEMAGRGFRHGAFPSGFTPPDNRQHNPPRMHPPSALPRLPSLSLQRITPWSLNRVTITLECKRQAVEIQLKCGEAVERLEETASLV